MYILMTYTIELYYWHLSSMVTRAKGKQCNHFKVITTYCRIYYNIYFPMPPRSSSIHPSIDPAVVRTFSSGPAPYRIRPPSSARCFAVPSCKTDRRDRESKVGRQWNDQSSFNLWISSRVKAKLIRFISKFQAFSMFLAWKLQTCNAMWIYNRLKLAHIYPQDRLELTLPLNNWWPFSKHDHYLTNFVSMAFYIMLTDVWGRHYSHKQLTSQTWGCSLVLCYRDRPSFPLEFPPLNLTWKPKTEDVEGKNK